MNEYDMDVRNAALSAREMFTIGKAKWNDMSVDKANREGMQISGWVYLAVKMISETGSTAPLVVHNANGEANWNHPLSKLLASPNIDFSSAEQIGLLLKWLSLTGSAYEKAGAALWPVSPDRIKPIVGNDFLIQGYSELSKEGIDKLSRNYTTDNVVRFCIPDPANPATGLSPLKAASRAAQLDNGMQDWNKALLDNRGNPDLIISTKETLTGEQKKSLLREIMMKFRGRKNAGRPMVIGGETKVERLGLTQQEMDFLASRKWNRDEILAIFGVPAVLAGAMESSTYNNYSEAKKIFWMQTIKPLLNTICEGYNKFYRNNGKLKNGEYIAPDYSQVDALSDNEDSKLERAKKMWEMGVPFKRINEKLGLGIEEFEGWDQPFGGKDRLISKDKSVEAKENSESPAARNLDYVVDRVVSILEHRDKAA